MCPQYVMHELLPNLLLLSVTGLLTQWLHDTHHSHRSLPFWQDVRIGLDGSGSKPHAPEHMRDNLAGLSVEYARRSTNSWGEWPWGTKLL